MQICMPNSLEYVNFFLKYKLFFKKTQNGGQTENKQFLDLVYIFSYVNLFIFSIKIIS